MILSTQKNIFKTYALIIFLLTLIISYSCNTVTASEGIKNSKDINTLDDKPRNTSEELKKYWFDGNAEITSFNLKQARYGEIHEGTAVLIYVTEPFSKTANTKADYNKPDNVPVLKLNTSKKFTTGIYPYSMMNSTFFPFEGDNVSIKISSSIQEWCGMTYTEMKTEETDLTFNLHSYFEGASFQSKKIKKTILEDDLWSLIRLNPNELPIGKQTVIPSMFYLNSLHKDFKPYKANLSKIKNKETIQYTIEYPELSRKVIIDFEAEFPNKIIGWNETYESGYGKNKKTLTTEASRIKSLKVDYWAKKFNSNKHLRDSLGLPN